MTQDSLEMRLREAEAACAARDGFIAAISRELNNPLSPVLLAVERLRAVLATGDAARTEDAMRLLERAAEAFAGRTRVLLNLADMMAGQRRLLPAEVDLAACVREAADRHREAARRAGCPLVCDVRERLSAIADAASIGQILDHLLANALRFGAGRPVRLELKRHGSKDAAISVIDGGPGLSGQMADSLFGAFRERRDPLEPGLGIGLWVASRLAAAMDGRIVVGGTDGGDAPGKGAHFHVILPVQPEASVAPARQNLQTLDQPAAF